MKKLRFIGVFTALLNAIEIPDNQTKKSITYSSTDIDKMLREMTGKSKLEKRKILKKYGCK